jgi:TRAP transporter TAXI family solute receptor
MEAGMKKAFAAFGTALALMLGLGLSAGTLQSASQAKTVFVTIGTGAVSGVYYPTGGAIAKIVNLKKKEYGIRATVESTAGSAFNIDAVLAGDLQFGIAQSDRQYEAWNGLAEWKDKGRQKDLRSVFSLHPEAVTLVAADDAGIRSIDDLRGKRVNIGNPGSGQRQNAIDALGAAGIDYEKDITAESVAADEAPGLLQEGRIDAYFYTVGHPSPNIKDATAGRRKVRIIDVAGPGLDKLIAEKPYYTKAVIEMASYPGALNTQDVHTFGVKATLITSAKVSDEAVYTVTKEVFDNLDLFKTLHPALAVLTKKGMLEGLTAPIHPGAMKYYQEAGLM